MRKVAALAFALSTLLPGASSAATLLVSPVPGAEATLTAGYALNQVRYELNGSHFSISRDIYAVSWTYESFFAGVGSIAHTDFGHDLDLDRFPLSGESGYLLAVGARGAIWRQGSFAFNAHAQAHHTNESVLAAVPAAGGFAPTRASYTMRSQEILAGIVAAWERPRWRAYAGIEAVPYRHIVMDLPGYGKMDRADLVSLHVGGGVDIGRVLLDADLQFHGTNGLRVGLGYAF